MKKYVFEVYDPTPAFIELSKNVANGVIVSVVLASVNFFYWFEQNSVSQQQKIDQANIDSIQVVANNKLDAYKDFFVSMNKYINNHNIYLKLLGVKHEDYKEACEENSSSLNIPQEADEDVKKMRKELVKPLPDLANAAIRVRVFFADNKELVKEVLDLRVKLTSHPVCIGLLDKHNDFKEYLDGLGDKMALDVNESFKYADNLSKEMEARNKQSFFEWVCSFFKA